MNVLRTLLMSLLVLVVISPVTQAETLVDRLLAGYDKIETVTCEVRKDTTSAAGSMRRLSRVYFQRPDRLHVDNVSPIPRRIIADGERLYSYIQGDKRGFSRPIAELDTDWLISLRSVPGSPVEHLLKMKGLPEVPHEPTPAYPVRMGYQAEQLYALLCLDPQGRVARIEFYASSSLQQKNAEYVYRGFQEPVPGVWLATQQQGTLWVRGEEINESGRISSLVVNQPVAASLFVVENFLKGIDFVPSMEEVYR